jgi:hypothetical protein
MDFFLAIGQKQCEEEQVRIMLLQTIIGGKRNLQCINENAF